MGVTNEANRRASFSNTGRHIGVSAPGTNILSTIPVRPSDARDETDYASWSGTSMATPHVSAAAALIKARWPDLAPREIVARLLATATRLTQSRTLVGTGLLNVQKALS